MCLRARTTRTKECVGWLRECENDVEEEDEGGACTSQVVGQVVASGGCSEGLAHLRGYHGRLWRRTKATRGSLSSDYMPRFFSLFLLSLSLLSGRPLPLLLIPHLPSCDLSSVFPFILPFLQPSLHDISRLFRLISPHHARQPLVHSILHTEKLTS